MARKNWTFDHSAWLALSAMVAWLGFGATEALGGEFAYYHENVLGTSLELVIKADLKQQAQAAEERSLAEIDRLARVFSNHDPDSEFRRFQRSRGPIEVSPELMEVLTACDRFRGISSGAFDPRAESFSRLWKACAARGSVPTALEIGHALEPLTSPAWRLDAGRRTAERLTDCPLSLDGIAKGYIVERACERAMDRDRGVQGALVNLGGDLCVRGSMNPRVAVVAPWGDSESVEPLTWLTLTNCSASVSGASQRGFQVGGRWYSHVIDPRTGRPLERVLEATVIAGRGLEADALAKVLGVLEPEESRRIVKGLPGVEFLVASDDRRLFRSAGFARFEQPPAAARSGGWTDFELEVGYEINQPNAGGRYRRPYVVVWVEDAEGKSVRTLILWVSQGGPGPFRWLPDLKRWYKGDQTRKKNKQKDIFFTVARPTRPAGKYKVVWDGKNDAGEVLPKGAYTISIEAAREHGTYQCIRKLVTLADQPFSEVLKGNVEIKSATIDYRRRDARK